MSWCVPDNPAHLDKNRQQREKNKEAETLRSHQRLGPEPAEKIQQPLVASYPASPIFSSLFPLQQLPPQAAGCGVPLNV